MTTTPIFERRELVRALIEVGSLLASPQPLRQRMEGLCKTVVDTLGCDRSSVLLWHGNHYRATYNFGNPPRIAERFKTFTIDSSLSYVQELEHSPGRYLMIEDTASYPTPSTVAHAAGIASVVLALIEHPNGEPIGIISAEYNERVAGFTNEIAEIAVGAAGLARGALMRDAEVQRRVALAEAMFEVEDHERRRLSREIHDDPLQRLLAIRVGVESCRDQVEDASVRATLDALVAECRDASSSLRSVMNRTHPAGTEQVNLDTTLRSLLARQTLDAGLWFSLEDNSTIAAPAYVAAAFARIAREAVSNTIQHADAQRLMLTITNSESGTQLTIADDGSGFCPASIGHGHLGLISMRERAELLGGGYELSSSPGEGTTISVWLPHESESPPELS